MKQRNDLRVYDQVEAWWSLDHPDLRSLRRLVPARVAYLQRTPGWEGCGVLDVGCGGGLMCDALARMGAVVTGVDIAEKALEAARLRGEREGLSFELHCASADALPFEDGCFDRVICTDVLVHVPDPAPVLGEIARVLRPGGRLFVRAINRNGLSRLVMVTLGEDVLRQVPQGTHDPAKFIRPGELREMCVHAGLDLQEVRGVGPVGWWKGLVFGRHPVTWVMYQGTAVRSD